jgi:hypothetical protein
MLYKDYERKYSVEKNAGRESQGACCQDELIDGKPPRKLTLILSQIIGDNVDSERPVGGLPRAESPTQDAMQSRRICSQSTPSFSPIVAEFKRVDSDVGLTPRP